MRSFYLGIIKKHSFILFFIFFTQQYIDEIKNIEKFNQNLKKLAKPVFEFLKEEQEEAVGPIKTKLDALGEQIYR